MPEPPGRYDRPRPPGGWSLADAAVATVCGVVLVGEVLASADMAPRWPLLVVVVLACALLAWRRAHPFVVSIAVASAFLVMNALATGPFPPQLAVLPLLIAVYAAGSAPPRRATPVVGAALLVLIVVGHVVGPDGDAADFWPYLLFAGPWAAGVFVRRRTDLAARHAARAALLEADLATSRALSAEQERARIARELHDVVAHAVSVMVVQAGAERLRLGEPDSETVRALGAIEDAGREALSELRAMLGVLREGGDPRLAPLPGVADLPKLVGQLRSAGLPVRLEADDGGEPVTASGTTTGAELAAYRIVQEALTNVVRHAGMVETVVSVDRATDALTVRVRNEAGATRTAEPGSSGRGLIGMRERAAALGGTITAGPVAGNGFEVVVWLPVDSRPTTPVLSETGT